MNQAIPIITGIGMVLVLVGLALYPNEPILPVTQQDLREMIDEWMNNPDENDTQQRLDIMRAYYVFEESGQKLSDDQEGRVMLNQIRKMVSIDIPKADLDEMKQEIRESFREQGLDASE